MSRKVVSYSLFENYLETHNANGDTVALGDATSMGNGIANDNYVLTSRISSVTSLDVNNQNINDLTGIEEFTALTFLNCTGNQLTSLDVSNNIVLSTLWCNSSNLSNLNLSFNTVLTDLRCSANNLTSLDLSNKTALTDLRCGVNNLTTLDLSNNVALKDVRIASNDLTNLDLSNNTALINLSCIGNNLISLDLSNNTVLNQLSCKSNELTSLNIANGNTANFQKLLISQNPNLICVTVDNETIADDWNASINLPSNFDKDIQTVFNTNCNEVVLEAKAYLQGAFINPISGEENLMRDDLRVAGLIPTTSPYSDVAVVNNSVFSVTGENAIVDWVWVELRDNIDNTLVVDGQSALLQRDGDIVGLDGILPLVFLQQVKQYNVVVNHRNHLGIMTNTAMSLSNIIDFTNANNSITWGSNAQTTFGMPSGIVAMWCGNANDDSVIQYSGVSPDTPSILSRVLNDAGNFLNFPTYVVSGYNTNDVDMDGSSQYSGTNPDTPLILQNVLAHPGNFLNFSTYQILEQLPSRLDN
ncbi:hypothetical protein [Kordia sp.]|uniref:hypothetical protein n=1 Tax=Kordia sp. TaxID=1965332 RepID=UPI00386B97CF